MDGSMKDMDTSRRRRFRLSSSMAHLQAQMIFKDDSRAMGAILQFFASELTKGITGSTAGGIWGSSAGSSGGGGRWSKTTLDRMSVSAVKRVAREAKERGGRRDSCTLALALEMASNPSQTHSSAVLMAMARALGGSHVAKLASAGIAVDLVEFDTIVEEYVENCRRHNAELVRL